MSFAATAASCPSCQPWEHAPGGPGSASGGSSQQRIEPVQRVRIVLFFDGTYNNKFNVAARKNGSVIKSVASSQASFANDESNVARMSDKLIASGSYQGKAYDEVVPVYVEGIGTTTLDEDSTYGGATGKGSTGILAKVEAGVTKALERLRRRPKAITFEFIHFDTFGFSRGAAAARNAVHRILNGRIIAAGDAYIELPGIRKGMTDSGFKVSDLKIRFVGLYDTVASLGVIHRFNTSELKLDSVSAADQVIHLAAADEHRANFRLTDTTSKKGGNSFELFLPGGHSDIGGGYNDNATANFVLWSESILRVRSTDAVEQRMANEMAWLRSQGWFTGPGNSLWHHNFPNGIHRVFYIAGQQTTASNQYCFIPLNIMGRRAGEQTLTFANLQRVTDGELLIVQSRLRQYENEKRHNSSPLD